MQPIIIPLRKIKMFFYILGLLAFLSICVWQVLNPSSHAIIPPIVIRILLLILALGILFPLVILVKRIFKKEGMVIDDKGIMADNVLHYRIGWILWGNVEDIRLKTQGRDKELWIMVNNAQEVMRKDPLLKRHFKKHPQKDTTANHMTIIPLHKYLKIDIEELYRLLRERFEKTA